MFRCVVKICFFATLSLQVQAFDVIWNRAGQSDSSRYGTEIIPLGDQDDDGYADWAVYAFGTSNHGLNQSYIEFFHGGNPQSIVPYTTLTPDSSIVQSFEFARLAGDINGDGYQDWMVGVRYYESSDSINTEVFFGGPASDLNPDFIFRFFVFDPTAVYSMGDFNGDGYDDLYISIDGYPDWDRALVLFGGPQPDSIPDWIIETPPAPFFQTRAESFGNLNGDGFDDFVSPGSESSDYLYIFHGSLNPANEPVQSIPDLAFRRKFIVNDVDGNGASELLLSSQGGMDLHFGGDWINATPDYWLNMSVGGSGPTYVSGIGDVNGDGNGDVGAVNDFYPWGWGGFRLYLGSRWPESNPRFSIDGRVNEWGIIGIRQCAGLGDVNGDGIDDFMVTGTNADFDGYRGRALIFAGDTNYVVNADEPFSLHPSAFILHPCYPNPFNPTTTISF